MKRKTRCTHEPTALKWLDGNDDLGEILQVEPGWYPDYDGWYIQTPCPFGTCTEYRCPVCNSYEMGWGLVACPCDPPYRHVEMLPRPRAEPGINPARARRRSGRHRARPKRKRT